MVTIKDVAKAAKVSTATVSRAIRGIQPIREETRLKILEVSKELGFVSSESAKKLKSAITKTIGFIISDANNAYYINIMSELKEQLKEFGYELIVLFSTEDPNEEELCFQSMIANHVEAILFTPTSAKLDYYIDIAIKNGIKVIQLFRDVFKNIPSIINDDEQGCKDAVELLLKEGYKRILLVDVQYEHLEYDNVSPNRTKGFLSAIKNAEYDIIHFPLINYNPNVLIEKLESYRPDSVITSTNISGFIVLSYIKKTASRIKLISFDDDKWFNLASVSAIRQDNNNVIKNICNLVLNDYSNTKIISPQKLINR